MAAIKIPIDTTKRVEFNLVSTTPHVIGYRAWTKAPTANTWTIVADGSIDQHEDSASLKIGPVVSGTEMAAWLGFGGHPNTPYRAVITIGQDGNILCTVPIEGTTNADGFAVQEREVTFS